MVLDALLRGADTRESADRGLTPSRSDLMPVAITVTLTASPIDLIVDGAENNVRVVRGRLLHDG